MVDEGSRLFDESFIARARLRKWAMVAVAGLLLVRLLAEVTPAMRRPDLAVLDFWQSIRATDRPSPQVVIVAVDEKSIDRFGPPAWPRSEYVPLVERLSEAGARVIGFDFTFGELARESENNALFAAAIEKAGNVVFGYEFTDVGDPSPPGTPPSEAVQANALSSFESIAILPAPSLIEPEPVLAEAAAAVGHVRTVASEDGRVRTLPLFIKHGDKAYPSLALQVARVYTGTSMEDVALEGENVRMGEWDVPVSASSEVLLGWPAEGELAYPLYSFLDVVRGDVPDEAFRGKAVMVAGTASGLDDRDLPYAVEAPGVLLYASFLDNVFRFDFVQAPSWTLVAEWVLFLAICGLVVFLLPRLPTSALLIGVPGLAVVLFGTSAYLYIQRGIWLEIVYPVLALGAPLGLLVAMKLTASEKQTRDVAAEKLENQKLLALSFQEKGMLDMALATFNKLPFDEDMKSVYLNLGLDYENRGQRDKAYIVYKKLFDADPGFEDVAVRMERLSQQGASPSLFPMTGIAATSMPQATGQPPMHSQPSAPAAAHSQAPAQPAPAPAPAPSIPMDEEQTEFSDPAPLPSPPAASEPTLRGEDAAEAHTGVGGPVPPQLQQQRQQPQPQPPAHTPGPSSSGSHPSLGAGAPSMTPAPGGPIMPGSRFGRYEIDQHLGRGGMGDVYLVRDTVLNRKAALKTIRVDTNLDPRQVIEIRQRFYREAQTTSKLTHPNVVTVYDVGEDLGTSYIVMEFVEGQTLTQWTKQSRLNAAQIKHVIYNAGLGLHYAHENGIFHRDVKPDNIMVSKSGIVKIMDFGIARIVESDLTKTGSVMGTPSYMSPEQVQGEKIDARSDVFSLGVILYELLVGAKPFKAQTMTAMMLAIMREEPPPPSTLDGKLSKSWDAVIAKALAKKADDRYQTAKELAQAVRDTGGR